MQLRNLSFLACGIAGAIVAGATLPLARVPGWATAVLALLLVAVAWLVAYPKLAKPASKPVDPNDYGIAPVYGTRRWARMMYANGVISMEELNRFYASHPE